MSRGRRKNETKESKKSKEELKQREVHKKLREHLTSSRDKGTHSEPNYPTEKDENEKKVTFADDQAIKDISSKQTDVPWEREKEEVKVTKKKNTDKKKGSWKKHYSLRRIKKPMEETLKPIRASTPGSFYHAQEKQIDPVVVKTKALQEEFELFYLLLTRFDKKYKKLFMPKKQDKEYGIYNSPMQALQALARDMILAFNKVLDRFHDLGDLSHSQKDCELLVDHLNALKNHEGFKNFLCGREECYRVIVTDFTKGKDSLYYEVTPKRALDWATKKMSYLERKLEEDLRKSGYGPGI